MRIEHANEPDRSGNALASHVLNEEHERHKDYGNQRVHGHHQLLTRRSLRKDEGAHVSERGTSKAPANKDVNELSQVVTEGLNVKYFNDADRGGKRNRKIERNVKDEVGHPVGDGVDAGDELLSLAARLSFFDGIAALRGGNGSKRHKNQNSGHERDARRNRRNVKLGFRHRHSKVRDVNLAPLGGTSQRRICVEDVLLVALHHKIY
mmetsp:Transcript_17709/g.36766  ORF Transcript_17709/g.36766 Transcript_17709/m.36766 type:complete len:207 (-) Transcript_17709:3544-4164(-)